MTLAEAVRAALNDGKREIKLGNGWRDLAGWEPSGTHHQFWEYKYVPNHREFSSVSYGSEFGVGAITRCNNGQRGIAFNTWRVR